ncbi:MAG: hypothetical protein K6G69_02330 [Lachnospiraceae bacterium]|nr:hypothetical protein [Lachnospiraceae bacterium]
MTDKTRNRLYILVIILLFTGAILPYMGVIFYTLPRNDEFAAAYAIAVEGGYSFSAVCKSVAHNYMVWEGNYSGIFLYTLFNPLVIGNTDYTIYIMNILTFAGFIVGWPYIIYRCLSFFDIEKRNRQLVSVIVLIMCMNCRFMRETLGWFTGYMYYTIQFMLGLFGMFITWKLIDHKPEKKWKTISLMAVACLFEMIGAGGTLHVSAILCFVILLFLVWVIYTKREWIKAAILFGAIFISTLVNVCAPGHKVRKGNYESIPLVKGVIYTVVCVYNEIKRLCTETYLPYVLLVFFLAMFFVIKSKKNSKALNPVIVFLAGAACIVGSSFPVCYGYGEADMASRGYEIMDILIVMWSVLFLCSLVNWLLGTDVRLSGTHIMLCTIFIVFMITTVAIDKVEISEIPSLQCWKGLLSGEVKDYSDYWRDVLHQVEDAKGGDVVIYVDGEYLDKECMIDRCMFEEDPTKWVNTAASIYYGYNSIRLERVDQ